MTDPNGEEKILDSEDASRRRFLRRLVGAAFVAPVITTFSLRADEVDFGCAYYFDQEDILLAPFEGVRAPVCSGTATTTVAATTPPPTTTSIIG
jgi:hypothetical protein